MNAICRPQTQVRAPRAGEAGRTPAGRSEGRSGAARGHGAAERTSDSAWHRGLALTAAPSSPHARQQSRAAGLASEAPPPPRPAAVATLKQRRGRDTARVPGGRTGSAGERPGGHAPHGPRRKTRKQNRKYQGEKAFQGDKKVSPRTETSKMNTRGYKEGNH